MGLFDWNIDKFINKNVPTRKRDLNNIEWIQSLLKGLKTTYANFIIFRNNNLLVLSYNSQTLIFNKLLNDNCDPTLKRIYIDNAADDLVSNYSNDLQETPLLPTYSFDLSEEPVVGDYVYSIEEYASPVDFTVYVPIALSSKLQTIRSLVNFYKLAGKRYIVTFF